MCNRCFGKNKYISFHFGIGENLAAYFHTAFIFIKSVTVYNLHILLNLLPILVETSAPRSNWR